MSKLTILIVIATLAILLCVSNASAAAAQEGCTQPMEKGTCRAARSRFYYDKESKQCQKFLYGGCGGNQNRFQTEEECKKACIDID